MQSSPGKECQGMPGVVDLDRKPGTGPKKPAGKPKPPPGPKPAVLVGIGVVVVLSVTFAIWFFTRNRSSTADIVPYSPPTRNLSGTGAAPTGTPTNVPRGLPGE